MRSIHLKQRAVGSTRRRRQRGAVAFIVGLSMTVMVAFVGLALDLGKLYVVKTELQNSADGCALAAAQALGGANGQQLAIAEAAGMTVGARHKVLFQASPVTMQADSSVEFSASANGYYATKNVPSAREALGMRYVRCKVALKEIDTWFIQALNILPDIHIGTQQVSASAVATLQGAQRTCAVPVAVCSDVSGAEIPTGTWLQGALDSADQHGLTGSFRWVDFTPPNGGANELAALLKGNGACDLPAIGTQVGQPGNVTSLANEWNSRFGIYQANARGALPDQSGFAYTDAPRSWPQQANAFPDFIRQRSRNEPYQGDQLTDLKTKGTVMGSVDLKDQGRDRRLLVAPVVRCADFASSQTAEVISWACIFLLHPINNSSSDGGKKGSTSTGSTRMFLEHRGNANDPASPCVSNGLPGASTGNGPLVTALVK